MRKIGGDMINIMKASAGSGKTFSLAKEYIKLLFGPDADPFAYRHILAVTFTNKATDEMKQRILKELHTLVVNPSGSPYLKELMELSPEMKESFISRRARTFLCNILNDYGAFSVSTIDRFFQRTLKAFSREIGQFSSYQVELDKESLVNESVDRILDSLSEDNRSLLGWLTDSVREQLDQKGRFSIEKQLYEMASALRSEERRELLEKYGIDGQSVYTRDNLLKLKDGCSEIIRNFRADVIAAAEKVIEATDSAGVGRDQSYRKFLTFIDRYAGLAENDELPVPGDSFLGRSADPGQWFPKSSAANLLPLVQPVLEEPLGQFCALFDAPYRVYCTALILKGQIYSLGLTAELDEAFSELMREKNVLCIDDSNTILKGIIGGSDTPFIYEKTGVRYDHFLLDEFQDTSNIQWENFRPLLRESDAGGNSNLVVGDVKQSIYRWRNSDWNLLNSRLKEEFPESSETVLDGNWRSLGSIVEFNNDFYSFAAASLDGNVPGQLSSIYSDVRQKVMSKDAASGNVDLVFCGKSEDEDLQMKTIISEIGRLIDDGASYSDIGVLVRTNVTGELVAKALLDAGIPVISDDSLTVKSSPAVRRLVALLSYIDSPEDKLNAYLAGSLNIEPPEDCHSLIDLCEYFIRGIKEVPGGSISGEIPYIQAFMDVVQDWSQVNGNSLQEFVSYWETVDPKIASPDGSDAVRIMTVHKSKGLDFNYVIFPYAESVNLYKPGMHWCRPDVSGSSLEDCASGIYRVNLSSSADRSLFSGDYSEEKMMQMVDAMNTFYVATTRARLGMTIISKMPSGKLCEAAAKCLETGESYSGFSDMSQVLYWYVRTSGGALRIRTLPDSGQDGGVLRYRYGEPSAFKPKKKSSSGDAGNESGDYCSWPLGDRLEFSPEAADFFQMQDGQLPGSSMRLKGIVLHDILSSVILPEDVGRAVRQSLDDGRLSGEEAAKTETLLNDAVKAVADRGWFPDDASKVHNEMSIIDSDGEVYRPDRVIVDDDRVMVVDYKFGAGSPKYRDQVRNYARLYRQMGYGKVTASLWYVLQNRVEDVE
ncbi:MAG: UvrD-helicase domain-containing protein [Candidatus Cryptobacteroides sp.]